MRACWSVQCQVVWKDENVEAEGCRLSRAREYVWSVCLFSVHEIYRSFVRRTSFSANVKNLSFVLLHANGSLCLKTRY